MNTKCWNDKECDAEESKQPLFSLSTQENVINFEFHLNSFQEMSCIHPDVKTENTMRRFPRKGEEEWASESEVDDILLANVEIVFQSA